MLYRQLNADRIETTVRRLSQRIAERFPGRGIASVCEELLVIAREDKERAAALSRSYPLIRTGVGLSLLLGAAGLAWVFIGLPGQRIETEATALIQGADAALNIVAIVGASSWFLLNLESRIRRSRILEDLHELRSIAHVIDMHQLTKDPTVYLPGSPEPTASSPARDLSPHELTRYLEYCSEMLSLTGKLAALYMRDVKDPVVISAVNEIEDLTTSLSRKVWQKIMILQGSAGG
jgi:hypothetical protein